MIFLLKFIHFQIYLLLSYVIRNLNYISNTAMLNSLIFTTSSYFPSFLYIFLKQEYYYVYELKEREIAKRQNRV